MLNNLAYLFIIFLFCSVVGYICEVLCKSIPQKKWVNRGFLCGPYCPIYGIGAIMILFTLLRYKSDPLTVFIMGVVITSALEYFTGFLLEKIFHNKWWDYSKYKYHINGRVCLKNSIWFGIGALAVIYLGEPFFTDIFSKLSIKTVNIIAIVGLIILLVDCTYSFIIAYNLRNRIIICEELKNQKIAKIPGMLERLIKERVKDFKTYPKRLLEAFPYLKQKNYKEFELMKKLREKNKRKRKK